MSEDTYQIRGDEVLAPGTLLAGRYEIVEFLAEGGMGRVYIALQRPIARKVALKVMRRELVFDNSSKKRFLREALAVSKLTHPNTITIIDYGDQEELCFIAMEFLDGMSLDRLLREGPMPLQRAVNIVGQIARSLSEAHRKGVIHRDLKPENIFVCEVDGNPDFVKVLDFGIARIQLEEGGGGVTRITREGYVCGTPEYMSPEQARGDEVDGRTDIYALGVMFWEMLEGEVPYDAPTPLGTVLKHQSDPVPPLSRRDLPEAIKQF
ncbi:MAG: serine/threonine-protein kinase, partial [Myxococcota bacterium]